MIYLPTESIFGYIHQPKVYLDVSTDRKYIMDISTDRKYIYGYVYIPESIFGYIHRLKVYMDIWTDRKFIMDISTDRPLEVLQIDSILWLVENFPPQIQTIGKRLKTIYSC